MKNITTSKILGLIGALLWTATLFLRDITFLNSQIWNFLLGIMPNIAAPLVITFLIEVSYLEFFKKKFTTKIYFIVSIIIFVLALASEIVHDLFLNSPFDINDIMATTAVLLIYLTINSLYLPPSQK